MRRTRAARSALRAEGFTLIEIMVVVAIIAIMSVAMVMAVTAVGGRDRELEKESDRLFALFNYAREQAELQTREYGVLFTDDTYEFVAYDVRRALWRSVSEDEALRLRTLPPGLAFKLVVDERPVVLARPKDAQDKTPQVMIFSNGDLTSFAATLERDGGVRSISVTEDEKGQLVEGALVEAQR